MSSRVRNLKKFVLYFLDFLLFALAFIALLESEFIDFAVLLIGSFTISYLLSKNVDKYFYVSIFIFLAENAYLFLK